MDEAVLSPGTGLSLEPQVGTGGDVGVKTNRHKRVGTCGLLGPKVGCPGASGAGGCPQSGWT